MVDPLAGRPPVLQELFHMPATEKVCKVFEDPVQVQCDLISEMLVREELELVLNY